MHFFIIKQQNIMEEIVEVRFYQWYVRKWDNAFFYCEKIEDKYVEGHGFINNEFEAELHFERPYFENEFTPTDVEYIMDYFDED